MVSNKKPRVKPEDTVAQEIALVKILCDNEQSIRRKGLDKLTRWLRSRSQGSVDLSESDFNRLWKGLFYSLWMADKPLFQEEVAEIISQMVHCFSQYEMAITFIKSFFNILGQEWPGIDHLRIDKCMMLVRRIVRQSFFILLKNNWDQNFVSKLAICYRTTLDHIPDGLTYHLCDVYINELSKVGGNKINSSCVVDLVRPFAEFMSALNNGPLICHIASTVFLNLIRLSEKGVEHESRFKAWRDRGFPGGTIDVIKKVDEDNSDKDDDCDDNESDFNDNEENKIMDPRAGRIDVELPTINCDSQQFVDLLKSLKTNRSTTTKARRQIEVLINKFNALAVGKYPLGLQKFEKPDKSNWKNVIRHAAEELIKFEENSSNRDDNNISLNTSCSSNNKLSDSVIERIGIWQVTPVRVRNGNKNQSSNSVDSLKSVTSKWVVVEKKTYGNESNDFSNNISCENNVTNKQLKRKSSDQHVTGSINSVKKCDEVKSENGRTNRSDSNSESDDGETEVLIKRPRRNRKRKSNSFNLNCNSNSVADSISEIQERSHLKLLQNDSTPSTPSSAAEVSASNNTNISSSAKRKRVAFLLTKNTVQEEREYQRLIKSNPVVQFDREKKPVQAIYKDKGVKSPINPFYKNLGFTSL